MEALVLFPLSLFLAPIQQHGRRKPGRLFSLPLIAGAWLSPFWLDPKRTKKIKGFPKAPWSPPGARLLSARAALSAAARLCIGQRLCKAAEIKAPPFAPGHHLIANFTGAAGKPGATMKVNASLSQFVSVSMCVYERANMRVNLMVAALARSCYSNNRQGRRILCVQV